MWNKSNCSVICILFKITFLGKWDESGHSLVSQIATHILCIFSSTASPPASNSSTRTSSGPVALRLAVWRMARSSNLWTKWWRFLLPIFSFNFRPFFIMVQVFTIPFSSACDLCSFSQIFASRWVDTLLTWLELSSNCCDYLEELPGIPFWVRCFQFHAHAFQLPLFICSELFLYLGLQFLISKVGGVKPLFYILLSICTVTACTRVKLQTKCEGAVEKQTCRTASRSQSFSDFVPTP